MFDYVTHLLIATRKNVLDCKQKPAETKSSAGFKGVIWLMNSGKD